MNTPIDHISQIILPGRLTDEQQRLLLKYARLPRSVTRSEWVQALAAFDLLHTGQIKKGDQILTFQAFYQHAVDAAHATAFIEDLLAASDVETEGPRLRAERWRQISAMLATMGLTGNSIEVRILLTYCLYWWQSFSKGYIREAAVFRDLAHSGIVFGAHDLRDPVSRRSGYDLTVMGKRGDVKSSTYFLHTAWAFPLHCDFYLVRLWNETTSQWLDLALLKPEFWRELDGEPTPSTWETVANVLPAVSQVAARDETLIVVPYDLWKDLVLRKQSLM